MRILPSESERQKVNILKTVPILRDLTAREILEVIPLLHERVYEKGEIIFEEGDQGHGLFVVLTGRVRAQSRREPLKAMAVDIGPGELIGELSLFEEGPRMGTVTAIDRTYLVALFRGEFYSLLSRDRNLGAKVLLEIARTLSRRALRLLQQEAHAPSL
jgi:CRP/FNR family transcriptional regulator, cyclic AMP receptor protein